MAKTTFTLIACFIATFSYAQFFATYSDEIPVFRDGEQLVNPWSGGINAAQVSTIDVNFDGLDDVFVFDRAGNKIMIFLNNGSNDPNTFPYSFEHSMQFPALRNWVLLRDFNCDGKKDIFTSNGIGGFRIYENVSTSGSGLEFVIRENNLQSEYAFGTMPPYNANIYITTVDIPTIDDIDGDGDLDIMVFAVSGLLLEYHRNLSVELTGGCDSLAFKLKNRCYGYFSESPIDNTITLHDPDFHNMLCPPNYNVADPGPGVERPTVDEFEGGARHAGTTILTIELNQEPPKEIVLGDIGATNLTALMNSTTSSGMDSIIAVNTAFPQGHGVAPPVEMTSFPGTFYEDLNNDGVRDLIVSPNDAFASLNSSSVWYYQNIGEDDLPVFDLVQQDLFQQQMIDVGEGATAFFFDYTGNGLQDMLVGNKGYFLGPGNWNSQLALYENTGTATNPEFTHVTDDFMGLGTITMPQGLHAAFGDLDGDGDDDMILGAANGQIYLYYNTAGPGNTAQFEAASDIFLKDSQGNNIDPGQYSTPQLIDLNRDGLIDLVMGERNGKIWYYENVGTATEPSFQLVTDFLGEVNTAEGFITTGYSVIQFFEMDDTYYLITGGEPGKIRLYSNIDDNLNGTFNLEDDMLFGLKNGMRSTVAVTDINNDGHPDLFTGNFGGGLLFLKGGEPTGFHSFSRREDLFSVYPNPTSGEFRLLFTTPYDNMLNRVEIFDAIGRSVARFAQQPASQPIQTSGLTPGVYIVEVELANNKRATARLAVVSGQ